MLTFFDASSSQNSIFLLATRYKALHVRTGYLLSSTEYRQLKCLQLLSIQKFKSEQEVIYMP